MSWCPPGNEPMQGCELCAGLEVVRFEVGSLPGARPFCSRCHRRLAAVEIEPEDRRRLAGCAGPGQRPCSE